jgi:hypothetical protein
MAISRYRTLPFVVDQINTSLIICKSAVAHQHTLHHLHKQRVYTTPIFNMLQLPISGITLYLPTSYNLSLTCPIETEKASTPAMPLLARLKNSLARGAAYIRYLYLKEFLETTQFRLQGLRKSVEELEKDEKEYRSNLEDAREALGKGYEMKFGEEGLGDVEKGECVDGKTRDEDEAKRSCYGLIGFPLLGAAGCTVAYFNSA